MSPTRDWFDCTLAYTEKDNVTIFNENDGFWFAEQTFIQMFRTEFTSGDPTIALVNPYSLVLSETSAKKYFGNIDPVGGDALIPECLCFHLAQAGNHLIAEGAGDECRARLDQGDVDARIEPLDETRTAGSRKSAADHHHAAVRARALRDGGLDRTRDRNAGRRAGVHRRQRALREHPDGGRLRRGR